MSEYAQVVDISELQNVESVCRVCLTEARTMFSLHSYLETVYEDQVITIQQALQKISCISMSEKSKYPSYICSMCLSLLNIAYKFILQFELSQNQLHQYFRSYGESKFLSLNIDRGNNITAPVEIISSQGKYNLRDLIIIEGDDEARTCYDGFLKNLGSEVTAEYVRTHDNQRKNTRKIEEYSVHVIPIIKKLEINNIYSGEEKDANEVELYTEKGVEDNSENSDNLVAKPTETNLTCSICDEKYSRKKLLNRHIKDMHKKNNEYLCQICGHVTKAKSSLHNHLLLKHFEKKFGCAICGKKYITKSHLRQHEIVHRNERSQLCTICGKTFNYANALQYHMRIHTGEKKYKCTYCDRAFTMQCGLSRHLRTHTGIRPYSCQFCDKAFCSKGEVRCHEMIHTGHRPYNCEHCGKGFTKTHNLKVHMMGHSGPHMCEFCQRGFMEVLYLKMHMKVAHGLQDYDLNSSTIYYVSEGENLDDVGETVVYTTSE